MHWFLDPITKHYVDFAGRVGRQEFWMFILFSCLIQAAFDIVGLDMISMLISLGLLLPSLAIGARRLHDTNKSGWWQLFAIVPIAGWILLIVLWAQKTDPIANAYGNPAQPKMSTPTAPTPTTPVATPAVSTETSSVTPDSQN